jgi:formate-dependent nitrite reductase membrane component NrfD
VLRTEGAAVTAYVLALGVVMPGLSGASGAERMAPCHTAFLAAAIVALVGAAALALFARTGGQKSAAKSG